MKDIKQIILISLVGLLIALGAIYADAQIGGVGAAPDRQGISPLRLGELTFHTTISDALHAAQSEDKMIYIYGRSQFCGWCKKFEAESFNDERIVALLNENFILLSIDTVEQGDTAVSLGIRVTPSSVFTTSEGQEIVGTRIPGYTDPDTFYQHLNEIINNEE